MVGLEKFIGFGSGQVNNGWTGKVLGFGPGQVNNGWTGKVSWFWSRAGEQ